VIDWLTDAFSAMQGWFFETAVQPLVYAVGLGGWTRTPSTPPAGCWWA